MIVDYIDGHKDRFGIEPICRVLNEHDMPIAPSTYHAHRACPVSDAEWADGHMANTALDIWRANRSLYGADKLATAMRNADHQVGRDQVARLMRILGIEGARRGKHRTVTTRRDPAAPRHPDLINRAWRNAERPDQWWVADFTYVWTLAGFAYASSSPSVLEAHPRLEDTRRSSQRASTLCLTRQRCDDSLSPSSTPPFRSSMPSWEAGIGPSIGTVGDALDNALMESTIGLHKTELVDHDRARSWSGAAELERETAGWVHWYNTTRIHHSIAKMSPTEFEERHELTNPAADDAAVA